MKHLALLALVPTLLFSQAGSGQPVPVASGGTGATNADAALTNLGARAVGKSILRTAAPGDVRYIRVNADGTTTLLTRDELFAALGIFISTVDGSTLVDANGNTLVDANGNTFTTS